MKEYDVVIVGAGVSGSALFYTLSCYTNVGKVALIEKNLRIADVNSHKNSNSQTLHFGDIETNYTLEKARSVKRAADMVKNYIEKNDSNGGTFTKYHKMVLALGRNQVRELKKRYKKFKTLFPNIELISRDRIGELEPRVVEGRDSSEEIVAIYSPDGYTMDFQALSELMVRQSKKKGYGIRLKTKVERIEFRERKYFLGLDSGEEIVSKVVIVACGAHSLLYAKRLGYGKHLALFCIAGSFYFVPKSLNGKVYTMQKEKLPFAAIHGDPDVHESSQTRFGPTAKAVLLLERHKYKTFFEYILTTGFSWRTAVSFIRINSDPVILKYILTNLFYDFPIIGKRMFLKEVRKIVPLTKLSELEYALGYGGVRPQIVNNKTFTLDMGEAKLVGENIIFNITPSPGASTCLKNAEDDAAKVVEFLGGGYKFDRSKFERDLVCGPAIGESAGERKKKRVRGPVSEETVLSFG